MIQNEHFRNCTVSFRTTSQHKLHIDRLAQASGLTTSEYLVHLTSRYAQPIEKFSGDLREVVEQKEENRKLQRRIKRLETDLENADTRVVFEQDQSRKKEGTIAEQGLLIQQLSAEIGGLQKTIATLKAIGQQSLMTQESPKPITENESLRTEVGIGEVIFFGILGLFAFSSLSRR
jgi:septal ring factor EnvC (AmiA/AmiB activator)